VQNPSPLPEDWSEASRPFRDLMRELEKLVE
jgi:hypothetical protein